MQLMTSPKSCYQFRPGLPNPELCKWWQLSSNPEDPMAAFCICPSRRDTECQTLGRSPYPQEDDGEVD